MKKGWTTKPLQALCDDFRQDIVDGPFGSELQRKDYITDGVPVLKIQNVKPFAIELKKMDYVSSSKFEELRRHSYQPGDIVMTKLGSPLGVSAIVEGIPEGVIVADLVRIRAQRVDTKYLCYHLNSQQTNDFINAQQKGTTRPRVTLSVVRELPILVPPLAEQQRIVGVLDEAFAGLATAQAHAAQNLQNARALFESHLQSVFTQPALSKAEGRGKGWVEKRLGDFATLQRGFDLPVQDRVSGAFPIVTSSGKSDTHHKAAVKGPGVVTGRSGSIGNVFYIQEDFWPLNTALYVKDFHGNDPRFVYHLLGHFDLSRFASGAGVPTLNRNFVHDEPVLVPPQAEQQAIATQLDALAAETQRLLRLYEQKQAALAALKKSLLHQAFTGEL
jgi:type I restriction enzyme S subunit